MKKEVKKKNVAQQKDTKNIWNSKTAIFLIFSFVVL